MDFDPARLVISEGAIKNLVSNIPGKTHLVERTRAVVCIWQRGQVRRDPG